MTMGIYAKIAYRYAFGYRLIVSRNEKEILLNKGLGVRIASILIPSPFLVELRVSRAITK